MTSQVSKPNLDQLQLQLVAALPVRARWWVGATSIDFSFVELRQSVMPCLPWRFAKTSRESREAIEPDGFRVFGRQSYSQGGGATPVLVLSEVDGSVFAFDAEATEPLRLLNSTVERFIRSFQLLDAFLTREASSLVELRASLADIDPETFGRSEWRELVDELTHYAEE
jgi:hypothetical protein